MKRNSLIALAFAGMAFLATSCGSKKNLVAESPAAESPTDRPMAVAVDHLKRVLDNQVSVKNIVSNMSFNIKIGSKNITVPGALRMRRDEVIRLQLFVPLLGTEVGRLEFTPNRVLIIDRLHKEYIEADYTQLDFLKNNDLDFYSLQALFWNQLAVPGKKTVSESDFGKFSVSGQNVKLVRDNMTYNWTTSANGQIVMTNVNYASAKSGASSLLWMYSDFKPVGVCQFPSQQEFQFTTTATKQMKTVKVSLNLDDVKDKDDWDVKTEVSSKYRKVEASEILGKLLSL